MQNLQNQKLFAVVKASLSPGAKACQAHHALREYASHYPFIEGQWWKHSNRVVILEHQDLQELREQARTSSVTCVSFFEPDWEEDGTLTALAMGPDAAQLLRQLPLAFRRPKPKD